jgi:hypothetical protein
MLAAGRRDRGVNMANNKTKVNERDTILAESSGERVSGRRADMKRCDPEPRPRYSRRQLILWFVLFNMAVWMAVLFFAFR